ncbi:MAG: phosphatase PAP2 family protein [Bacteroidetes bacterium]|nr:phosphatase PAP2 family protein [Bacteroidota bacterium]
MSLRNICKNKNYGYLFFGLALLVAISRVYLMQHFLVDVYFGSLFGLIFTLILYQLLMISPLFRNKKWHERSFIKGRMVSS